MIKTDIVWFAGFFDGEGSVAVIKTKSGNGTVYLWVYQKERRVLRRIRKIFGGTLSSKNIKASSWQKRRKIGQIQWSGMKARRLAALILPFLRTNKAKKVRQVLRTPVPKYYNVR